MAGPASDRGERSCGGLQEDFAPGAREVGLLDSRFSGQSRSPSAIRVTRKRHLPTKISVPSDTVSGEPAVLAGCAGPPPLTIQVPLSEPQSWMTTSPSRSHTRQCPNGPDETVGSFNATTRALVERCDGRTCPTNTRPSGAIERRAPGCSAASGREPGSPGLVGFCGPSCLRGRACVDGPLLGDPAKSGHYGRSDLRRLGTPCHPTLDRRASLLHATGGDGCLGGVPRRVLSSRPDRLPSPCSAAAR
jgi:hypothetical protein